ncbi:MAG: response regulator [Candidatus Scalindua sp.]
MWENSEDFVVIKKEWSNSLKGKKILLIEGDPGHADLVIDILKERHKRDVVLKKDGEGAVDYIQKINSGGEEAIQSSIDMVILDLNIPKVDGMDILKFLKKNQKFSSIPVIIFSTSSDRKTIDEAYKNGANGYITKPISHENLIKKIKTLREYC